MVRAPDVLGVLVPVEAAEVAAAVAGTEESTASVCITIPHLVLSL